jgi:hypothetical protein
MRGWLNKEMSWPAPHDRRSGRPSVFSDAAIQVCLTIKGLFRPPVRQTTGRVAGLLAMASLGRAVPDNATLCRRRTSLAVQIPYRHAPQATARAFDEGPPAPRASPTAMVVPCSVFP